MLKKTKIYMFVFIMSAILCLFTGVVCAAGPWSVSSPDGTITGSITQAADGSLSYAVTKGSSTVIENSSLGINTGLADFKTGLTFTNSSLSTINESYSMVAGKKSTYTNHCNELGLNFTKDGHKMSVFFRAYNDGIAYRYYLPTATSVSSEYSQFNMPDGNCWIMNEDYAYEKEYLPQAAAAATAGTGVYSMCPAFQLNNGYYVWLGEASVYSDYCNSNLRGSGASDGVFNVVNISGQATSSGTNASPWRAAVIGGMNTLIETTLIENLNPSSEIADTSWIKTGGSSWEWLNGDSCSSLAVAKKYIDFSAAMGWNYYIADYGWSESWAPEMCAYGNSKGVGVILWAHHNDLDTQAKVDTLLTKWAGWGAKGIKVDFFDGERQLENQERDRITVKAAALKLVVNYHGTTKPTGTSRRWPHLLTFEAVKGNENYPTDSHYSTLPFTRSIAGPADITSVMTWAGGTAGYETATALTILSGYNCYCSKPGQYESYPTKEFLKVLPTSFDESRFVEGSIGSYISVARRKGTDWFVGGTTVNSRTAVVPLSFLGSGTYVATIYRDNDYSTQLVTNATTLSLPCAAKGGFVVYISNKALPAPAAVKSAYAQNEAETFNSKSGSLVAESNGQDGINLGGVQDNNYAVYNDIDFGSGASEFQARISCDNPQEGGTVEIRLDSPTGTLAGTLTVAGTGAWQNYTIQTCTVNNITGKRKIYLVFKTAPGKGYVCNLDWFKFTRGSTAITSGATYVITNRLSDMPLDVYDNMTSDGADVIQWPFIGGNNQKWTINDLGDGSWSIINVNSSKALDVYNSETSDGADVIQWSYIGGNNQKWIITDIGDGYYSIINKNSGKSLDVTDNQTFPGADVIQWTFNNGNNQKWQIVKQ